MFEQKTKKTITDIIAEVFNSTISSLRATIELVTRLVPVSIQSAISTQRAWDVAVPSGTSWESDEFSALEARKVVASFYADGAVTCWVYEKDGEYVIPRGKVVLDGTEEIAQAIEFAPTRPAIYIEVENSGAADVNVDVGLTLQP